LLVVADTLDDLEEEPVVERIGIGMQELPCIVAVVQELCARNVARRSGSRPQRASMSS
jgi:hypothetical protein